MLTQKACQTGVHKVEKAKVALIQFCISPPKSDMDSQVVISDYTQMDRILREERAYILDLCKKVQFHSTRKYQHTLISSQMFYEISARCTAF